MVKGPHRTFLDTLLVEKEYYASDDDRWLGVVVYDSVDSNYSVALLRREGTCRYRMIDQSLDIPSIENARSEVLRLKEAELASTTAPQSVFDPIVVRPNELHPYFKLLRDDDFYSDARRVI